MVEPTIVPRSEHRISRRDIDPDALKVLYRLRQFEHTAYLVGGSVRDLLLSRRPKDFDIGTSAHPYQVKRLFRNCWIIGRRFRLAHVKFGPKIIEVATFRRQVPAGTEEEPPRESLVELPEPGNSIYYEPKSETDDSQGSPANRHGDRERLIHRDNTFGTPEEDAFRRDFTINALFYDIETYSVIDYVGGLSDLRASLIRSIGDPNERFREDPVRMLRAIALAARLNFGIDPAVEDALARNKAEIARSAPARLLEEFYKILRAGAAEKAFRSLFDAGLLEHIAPELHHRVSDRLWESLASLDAFRKRFESTPDTLTNATLLGSLLVPLGFPSRRFRGADREAPDRVTLGTMPIARRDVERLRLILSSQRRLLDLEASPRAQRAFVQRHSFLEALTWLDIHGSAPSLVEHWKGVLQSLADGQDPEEPQLPLRPRRRRRRGRPVRTFIGPPEFRVKNDE